MMISRRDFVSRVTLGGISLATLSIPAPTDDDTAMLFSVGDFVRYQPQAAVSTQNWMKGVVMHTKPCIGGAFVRWEDGSTNGYQRGIHGKLKPCWSFEENLEHA